MTALTLPVEARRLVIDDFAAHSGISALGTRWSATSDRVMGGSSHVHATRRRGQQPHIHLSGTVQPVPRSGSPGFVQVALDLGPLDASRYTGLELLVRGDGKVYGAHLRTPDVQRPWQSWRGRFLAPETWTVVQVPFTDFRPHRIEGRLDTRRLRRLSLIALDETGPVDLQIAEVALYS